MSKFYVKKLRPKLHNWFINKETYFKKLIIESFRNTTKYSRKLKLELAKLDRLPMVEGHIGYEKTQAFICESKKLKKAYNYPK